VWVVSKAVTRVGKKVGSMVELKDAKEVEHWVVTMAAKKAVRWVD